MNASSSSLLPQTALLLQQLEGDHHLHPRPSSALVLSPSSLLISNLSSNRAKVSADLILRPAVLSSVVAATIWMIIFDPRGLGTSGNGCSVPWHRPQVARRSGHGAGVDDGHLLLEVHRLLRHLFITGLASILPTIYGRRPSIGRTRARPSGVSHCRCSPTVLVGHGDVCA